MMKENMQLVRDAVAHIGKELEGKLPDAPGLLKRNSYAHLWKSIKEHFGASYRNLRDDDVDLVLAFLEERRQDAIHE